MPIAQSWIIRREISATFWRSDEAPLVIEPKTSSSAARPPSATTMRFISSERVLRKRSSSGRWKT